MSTQIKFGLKNDADAVYGVLNRKREFYLVIHNFQGQFLPQVKVVITGPPEVRILRKSEWYGGIRNGNKKSRLFSVIPKAEGVFTLTATLSSKNIALLTLPVNVKVGDTQFQQQPIVQQTEEIVEKPVSKTNCPFCGEQIESDAKFCPICGANLTEKLKEEKKTKICPNCGQELPLEAKFCAKCGEKVENIEES
ncbi:MAG: zinc ribbon domain-containing protein [Promethearchaeota archaeon]|jgi:rRNA maturation endonuclease Nob1